MFCWSYIYADTARLGEAWPYAQAGRQVQRPIGNFLFNAELVEQWRARVAYLPFRLGCILCLRDSSRGALVVTTPWSDDIGRCSKLVGVFG